MYLSTLIPDHALKGADREITGLSRDSRTVQTGFLFAALPGASDDGSAYIADALAKGAHAVLARKGVAVPPNIPCIFAEEPRKVLAEIAARFYGIQPEVICAVTGTSGKTSTVQFTRQIWQHCGHKSASIGTLGIIGDGIERYGSLTTPDAISLHQDLAMLAREKSITHVAMEASSHGLDQYRLDGVALKAAAFTNLSRDHLDYHSDMASYLAAKLRLFSELLPPQGMAVINKDCPEYDAVVAAAQKRNIKTITFGHKNSDLHLLSCTAGPHGQELILNAFGQKKQILLNLVGSFQSANALCAAGLAIASGEEAGTVLSALPALTGVRGRMEYVGNHQNAAVFVDYAHKPDALENVLKALRPHAQGKLVVVFGCGGNRDAGKRPIMGAIAGRLADSVIVTDDNPRHENPASIRKAVMAGCPLATEIAGRGEAIAHAFTSLRAGDVLIIAGKGHEQGQIIGDETLPFDDADFARSLMKGRAA